MASNEEEKQSLSFDSDNLENAILAIRDQLQAIRSMIALSEGNILAKVTMLNAEILNRLQQGVSKPEEPSKGITIAKEAAITVDVSSAKGGTQGETSQGPVFVPVKSSSGNTYLNFEFEAYHPSSQFPAITALGEPKLAEIKGQLDRLSGEQKTLLGVYREIGRFCRANKITKPSKAKRLEVKGFPTRFYWVWEDARFGPVLYWNENQPDYKKGA